MYPYGDEAADVVEDDELDELALFIIIGFYLSLCHSLDASDCLFSRVLFDCRVLSVGGRSTALRFFWRESESVGDE